MEVNGRDRYLHGKGIFPYCFLLFTFFISLFLFLLPFYPSFFCLLLFFISYCLFIFFFSYFFFLDIVTFLEKKKKTFEDFA